MGMLKKHSKKVGFFFFDFDFLIFLVFLQAKYKPLLLAPYLIWMLATLTISLGFFNWGE